MGKKVRITLIVVCALIVAAAFGYALASSATKKVRERGLKIEKTANIIEKVSKLARFTTACYYEELVVTRRKTNSRVDNAVGNKIADILSVDGGLISDELCMIAKGTVRAGYDLFSLNEESLRISGDTLFVQLPNPQVFDVQLNPSDCEYYVREGRWSEQELGSVQREARNRLYSNALDSGILKTAQSAGETQLKELFSSFGFKAVVLE